MVVFLADVLPHDEQNGCANEAILDGAREQVRGRIGQKLIHNLVFSPAAHSNHGVERKPSLCLGIGFFVVQMHWKSAAINDWQFVVQQEVKYVL